MAAKKMNYEDHKVACRKVGKAFSDLLTAIMQAPDNCNITVRIESKGGVVQRNPEIEYLIIKPMISLASEYEKIKSRK